MEFDSLGNINIQMPSPQPTPSTPKPPTTKSAQTSAADDAYTAPIMRQSKPSNVKNVDRAPTENVKNDQDKESNKERKPTEFELDKTLSDLNKKIAPLYLEFQYKVHEKTHDVMISVINSDTKEIIREIPPEKSLDALAKMWELAGILVDEKK